MTQVSQFPVMSGQFDPVDSGRLPTSASGFSDAKGPKANFAAVLSDLQKPLPGPSGVGAEDALARPPSDPPETEAAPKADTNDPEATADAKTLHSASESELPTRLAPHAQTPAHSAAPPQTSRRAAEQLPDTAQPSSKASESLILRQATTPDTGVMTTPAKASTPNPALFDAASPPSHPGTEVRVAKHGSDTARNDKDRETKASIHGTVDNADAQDATAAMRETPTPIAIADKRITATASAQIPVNQPTATEQTVLMQQAEPAGHPTPEESQLVQKLHSAADAKPTNGSKSHPENAGPPSAAQRAAQMALPKQDRTGNAGGFSADPTQPVKSDLAATPHHSNPVPHVSYGSPDLARHATGFSHEPDGSMVKATSLAGSNTLPSGPIGIAAGMAGNGKTLATQQRDLRHVSGTSTQTTPAISREGAGAPVKDPLSVPPPSATGAPATPKMDAMTHPATAAVSLTSAARIPVQAFPQARSTSDTTRPMQMEAPPRQWGGSQGLRQPYSFSPASGQTLPNTISGAPGLAIQSDPILTPVADTQIDLAWDAPRALQNQAPAQSVPARTDLPQHTLRQIAEAAPQASHRPVEIALAPEELGRLRMSVATDERGIVVHILAERPETLDLMRRHIDQLGQNFRQIGYDTISFSFGQGSTTDRGESSARERGPSGGEPTEAIEQPTPQISLIADDSGGVDIRL
ncbi:flagellar hook-length control protein FliK [Sulfitobacter albidus]|uniref:Flagellar hook-length control protein FliK n=1 Tax=Sulfitobacter albidus TaxID=2829501 RepID=A0A975JD69_9RHOB|nr:flagellar hook-length control protein FliK [Sulfitobacter albidus]QUJ76283.1 flagellar hook-length control protein FliK [Sulfitobacter albidus]